MQISTETVVNVVSNVVSIIAVLFAVYAAMYVLEAIIKFCAGAFDNVKLLSSISKGTAFFRRLEK